MVLKAHAARVEAAALLAAYEQALCATAPERAAAHAAGVSSSTLATLYPYDETEWQAGLRHLLDTTSVINKLTLTAHKIPRRASGLLTFEMPGGSEAVKAWYCAQATTRQPEANPWGHMQLNVLLLHVLTFSPLAPTELVPLGSRAHITAFLNHTRRLAAYFPEPE